LPLAEEACFFAYRASDGIEPDGVVHVTEAIDVSTPSEPGLTFQLASRQRLIEVIDV
tara:strand:+ start:1145335 stop:1145505 length:171 start_codon:yes stop_codon:yes gene_type:complete